MKTQLRDLDNGYISDYLVHWTGRKGLREGFANLLSILEHNRLKLGFNPFAWLDMYSGVGAHMVCFTDVPIRHSRIHCARYGRFGIAFSKRGLASVGAHPVFYYTHSTQKDVQNILRFLGTSSPPHIFPGDIYEALTRYFFFCQEYGKGMIDSRDAFYYEREWRLGEGNLEEDYGHDGTVTRRWREGKPNYFGKILREGDHSYFEFKADDIAFIILPRRYERTFRRSNSTQTLEIRIYEDLVAKDKKMGNSGMRK